MGNHGNIYSDGVTCYIYYSLGVVELTTGTKIKWGNVKKRLSELTLINDGDDEGRFMIDVTLVHKYAKAIRKVLRLRKVRILTDEQRAALYARLKGAKAPTK